MSFICDNCGKGIVYGASKSHKRGIAGKRWNKRAPVTGRVFKPNLQKAFGMTLCTNCISRLRKEGKFTTAVI